MGDNGLAAFYDNTDLAVHDAEPDATPSHFDAEAWAAVRRYIRLLADLLALQNWAIYLDRDPSEEDNNAETIVGENRRLATMKLTRDWRHCPPEEQRHTLVHELIHLPVDRLSSVLESDLDGFLSAGEQSIARNVFRREVEAVVDALADGVAPHLPLPVSS